MKRYSVKKIRDDLFMIVINTKSPKEDIEIDYTHETEAEALADIAIFEQEDINEKYSEQTKKDYLLREVITNCPRCGESGQLEQASQTYEDEDVLVIDQNCSACGESFAQVFKLELKDVYKR